MTWSLLSSLIIPRRLAIASAVSWWSPVIIIGRIPASLATRTASAASGRSGSIIPIIPVNIKSFSRFSDVKFSGMSSIIL